MKLVPLALLFVFSLEAQYTGLATTADGSVLYFSTPLKQIGTDQPEHGKIFRMDRSGLKLFVSRPRVDPVVNQPTLSQLLTNAFDLTAPDVSDDGSVVSFAGGIVCIQRCTLYLHHESTVILRDGREVTVPDLIRLSADGRYAASFSTGLTANANIWSADLQTGEKLNIVPGVQNWQPLPPRSVSNDGITVRAGHPESLLAQPLRGPYAQTPLISEEYESIEDAVIEPSGDRIYFTSRWPAPNDQYRRVRYWSLRTSTYGTTAEGAGDFYAPSPSSDGNTILFLSNQSGSEQAYVTRFGTNSSRQITTDPDGIQFAILSGNGQIAYATTFGGRLIRIDVETDAVTEVVGRTPWPEPPVQAAPGSLFRIRGTGFVEKPILASPPYPTQLGGLQVLLDGRALPILSASRREAVVQIPWDFLPRENLPSELRISTDTPRPAFENRRAQMLVSEYAENVLAIVNEDFSKAITLDNPARKGQVLHIFATGLGAVEGSPITGQPAPVSPLFRLKTPLVCEASKGMGFVPVDVFFAGLAPGLTGIYQVDLRVPADATVSQYGPLGTSIGCSIRFGLTIPIAP